MINTTTSTRYTTTTKILLCNLDRRGAFMGMVSEGHAGTEDESAAEDEGD